ncbi:hypothetical protein [Blastococcus brunescens]|uniref:Uncharacterized protein n=1 Tax=Blastococcus brunescens TaxID=1564165 RepID=A0ABZ1B5S5_9ACTN|nr:hypothetical protein [Blastococcus sp. BMG 8361]WRL66146.1 hypothetical protein U6N30_12000 [Blastococcus sp. BMG 8361]
MQMGVYLRPKTFKERFDYVVDLFPCSASDAGPRRVPSPAASGRWSPWGGH